MLINSLPVIPEIEEESLPVPLYKHIPLENAFESSFHLNDMKVPQTPLEIHEMLQNMDNHYNTNFLPWVTDGMNATAIASTLNNTLSELHVTPLKLGSVLQAITLDWPVVETSYIFKSCYEYINKDKKYFWTSKDWVPVLLSVTSPATIVLFMGLLLWNITVQEHMVLHPILEVFKEGFGIHQTVSLIRALDKDWVGMVRWSWKLSILKQWGTQVKTYSSNFLLTPQGNIKRRRASESILNGPERKSIRYN
ncbi:hypothetical protein HMI54_015348 [Coelomomyces lativittatus]|nr:hypothetical protein HMI56_006759 [Coelomomyces lativittatus]KAJ1514913.1 hypothetical protein HMI55_004228 [Coelomomyces lativittatus]KAJ1518525.1 hypothetical protein HMI54_015348 [Coelomomyces lativittatus]